MNERLTESRGRCVKCGCFILLLVIGGFRASVRGSSGRAIAARACWAAAGGAARWPAWHLSWEAKEVPLDKLKPWNQSWTMFHCFLNHKQRRGFAMDSNGPGFLPYIVSIIAIEIGIRCGIVESGSLWGVGWWGVTVLVYRESRIKQIIQTIRVNWWEGQSSIVWEVNHHEFVQDIIHWHLSCKIHIIIEPEGSIQFSSSGLCVWLSFG